MVRMSEDIDTKVWLIGRPHYSPIGVLEKVGICGSGFLLTKNIFVTAHHTLNESSFLPNAYYFNSKIFLISPTGNKIEIDTSDIAKLCPEIDVTFVKIKDDFQFFKTNNVYSEGDFVINIGYPTRLTSEILDKNLGIKKQFNNFGKILKIYKNYTMNANDVKIKNKKVIILDYTSEMGFSGGPLLKNNKVIGIMSHLYPNNGNAVAIAIEEVLKFLP
jgi:hypothetical protein